MVRRVESLGMRYNERMEIRRSVTWEISTRKEGSGIFI